MTPPIDRRQLLLAASGLLALRGVAAQGVVAQPGLIELAHAWIPLGDAPRSADVLLVAVTARQPLTLVAVATPAAERVELLQVTPGVRGAQPVTDGLALAAGETAAFEADPRDRLRLVLHNPPQPLQRGSVVPVTFTLRDAAGQGHEVALQVPVGEPPPGTPVRVVMRVLVANDGKPVRASVRTSSGFLRLDQAAYNSAMGMRYPPHGRNGVNVPTWFVLPFRFVNDQPLSPSSS